MLADGSIAPPRTLHALLGASPAPLTHKDLLTRWPGDKPREDSLWRALARGLEAGLMHMTGEGTESAPPAASRWRERPRVEDALPVVRR